LLAPQSDRVVMMKTDLEVAQVRRRRLGRLRYTQF
jgi:hypothetical protein